MLGVEGGEFVQIHVFIFALSYLQPGKMTKLISQYIYYQCCHVVVPNRLCSGPDLGSQVHSDPDLTLEPNRIRIYSDPDPTKFLNFLKN